MDPIEVQVEKVSNEFNADEDDWYLKITIKASGLAMEIFVYDVNEIPKQVWDAAFCGVGSAAQMKQLPFRLSDSGDTYRFLDICDGGDSMNIGEIKIARSALVPALAKALELPLPADLKGESAEE